MAKVQSSTWIFLNPLLLPQKQNEMRKLLFCLFFLCFPWLWLQAQQRIAFARLPPFERAVVCVKFFEGFHGKGCYPYVGYGHQLQKGEHFSSNMPEWQADSLLRADLWRNSTASNAMAKMLYSFLFWLIMSALGD